MVLSGTYRNGDAPAARSAEKSSAVIAPANWTRKCFGSSFDAAGEDAGRDARLEPADPAWCTFAAGTNVRDLSRTGAVGADAVATKDNGLPCYAPRTSEAAP